MRRWWRMALVALLAAWGMLLTPVAAQHEDITLTAQPAFQGFFRPGTWVPVQVEAANNGVDQTAEIVVGTVDGPTYSTTVDLPGGSRKGVTVYAYVPAPQRQLRVRLMVNGVEARAVTVRLQPVTEGVLVGVVGAQALRLPAQLTDGIKVFSVPLTVAELPAESLGLSPLAALILTDLASEELTSAQQTALQEWVLRGGALIVNGGSGAQRALAALPPTLVPATPGQPLPPLAEPPVTPVELAPRRDEQGRPAYPVPLPFSSGLTALAFAQRYGEGQTILLAFDLASPEVSGWSGWRDLWQTLLPPPAFLPLGMGFGPKLAATFSEENLASALSSLPSLDLPSLTLLGWLLGCYIVIAGPVTYLVLRRLDRLAWGWVVVPALTVIFAVVAYIVGYGLRGGEVIINQITLVDAVEPSVARERSFIGVFSPDQSAYRLQASEPTVLARPITVQGPWSSELMASGRFRQGTADGSVVADLTIAQWSLQAVAIDRIVAAPGLEARVQVNGDAVQGDIVNRGNRSFNEVVLVYGDMVGTLASLAPGERQVIPLIRPSYAYDGIMLSNLIYGQQIDDLGRSGRSWPPELQLRTRILDALYGYGATSRGAQPMLLAWSFDQETILQVAERRASRQHLTLVRGFARLEMANDIKLNGQSFAATIEASSGMNSPCYSGTILGVTPDLQPTTIRYDVPRDLYDLRPATLILNVRSDSFWAGQVELYDWTTASWTTVLADAVAQATAIPIDHPERFLGPQAALRVRVQNRDPIQNYTCVYVEPIVQGRLP